MGYNMPIVSREIHLPIEDGDDLNLKQYKEKYGIDLAQFITLKDDGYIYVDFPLYAKVFVVSKDGFSGGTGKFLLGHSFQSSNSDHGLETNAITIIGEYDPIEERWVGIQLHIGYDESFIIDNLIVSPIII